MLKHKESVLVDKIGMVIGGEDDKVKIMVEKRKAIIQYVELMLPSTIPHFPSNTASRFLSISIESSHHQAPLPMAHWAIMCLHRLSCRASTSRRSKPLPLTCVSESVSFGFLVLATLHSGRGDWQTEGPVSSPSPLGRLPRRQIAHAIRSPAFIDHAHP